MPKKYTKYEKRAITDQKKRNREYDTHWWFYKKLKAIHQTSTYKYEKYKEEHEKLAEEIQQASYEYLRGHITKKEFNLIKRANRPHRGRKRRYMAIWKERKEYIEMMMQIEQGLLNEKTKLKGIHDYINRTGRGVL